MTKNDIHKYLGRNISGDTCDRANVNILYRTECAWAKYRAHKKILTNKNIAIKLQLRLFDCQQRSNIASTRSNMLRGIVGFSKRPGESREEFGRRCKLRMERALLQSPVSNWLHVMSRAQGCLLENILRDHVASGPRLVLKAFFALEMLILRRSCKHDFVQSWVQPKATLGAVFRGAKHALCFLHSSRLTTFSYKGAVRVIRWWWWRWWSSSSSSLCCCSCCSMLKYTATVPY